jgi:flagellar hook-length control protein FliK
MAEDDLLASAAPRRVTVELSPSHLGKVQIEIVQDPNRSLTVHLTASAEHTRMALDADADDLVQHLRHHSLDVNKVEVKGESDPQDGRGRDSLRQRSDDGLSREGRQSSEDRRDRGASRRPHDFTDYRYWEAIR